jgi:hypothetical protein
MSLDGRRALAAVRLSPGRWITFASILSAAETLASAATRRATTTVA